MADASPREVPAPRAFGSLEEEAALSLERTAERFGREVADLLQARELTPVQYGVLRILRGAGPRGLTAGELGERMPTQAPDVTRLVDRLERQGRVRRERPPEDRRSVRIRITEQGLRTLAELDRPLAALHRRQLGHLGQERLRHLIDLLNAARRRG